LSLDRVILSGRDAPAVARREFRSFAGDFGDDVSTTGSLLVSEMVTNAVQHGPVGSSSTIALHCAVIGERLQVEIADDGGGFVPREDGQETDDRRGLRIVESLAATWGVDRGRPTRVWFELAI
jgi:anti-sigma regulatory factor (Ser/Thr protein kinase)